jgi:hypothetical protein
MSVTLNDRERMELNSKCLELWTLLERIGWKISGEDKQRMKSMLDMFNLAMSDNLYLSLSQFVIQ